MTKVQWEGDGLSNQRRAIVTRAAKAAREQREKAFGTRLSKPIPKPRRKPLPKPVKLKAKSPRQILEQTALRYDTTVADLRGAGNSHLLAPARHELWFRLHDELGYSANKISKMFGRNYSTILNAYKKHKERMGLAEQEGMTS